MQHSSYVEDYGGITDWNRRAAPVCADIGGAMVGLGLLYWGLLLGYAVSLSKGWLVALTVETSDPLAAVRDPFLVLLWIGYWWVAIGLLRRGLGEPRTAQRSNVDVER